MLSPSKLQDNLKKLNEPTQMHQNPIATAVPSLKEQKNSVEAKNPQTRVSKLGIFQNPTGIHEGKRVWGGGIIKIPQHEWIPWPIDLDSDDNREGESFMGAAPTKGVHAMNKAAKGQGIYTEHAFAANFGSVQIPKMNEPNVFSPGHIPPWIKPYEAELFPELITSLAEARHKSKEDRKNPNRVGAAWVAQRKAMGIQSGIPENWLPNFGRVFNHGPRSATSQEFRIEQFSDHK